MKDWQHGYDMEMLLAVEKRFHDYNHIVLSPFAQMKKNKIAMLLHENKLDGYALPPEKVGHDDKITWIPTNVAKHAIHVKAYGNVELGIRQKGERMVDNPVGDKELLLEKINEYPENTWMTINSEYKLGNDIAKELHFKKVGIKVNSFSDIINVYARQNSHLNMKITKPSPIEKLNVKKIGTIAKDDMTGMRAMLSELHLIKLFANHYSNYNKKKSWSAVSLRGFSPAFTFIEKPTEMSDKWKKENADVDFTLQDTPLMKKFEPYIGHILKMLPAEKERVRLMKLEADGGVLDRHTDQTDKELGTTDGRIIRLHIPLFTNDKVRFESWNWEGNRTINYMREGELWYLDIRKPHRAINKGISSRVHLVIDVIANNSIRGMIEND